MQGEVGEGENRNIQFAEKAEVSLFVRHVCARPSRHFGPVQTPSVVARASSAVDSSGCQSAPAWALANGAWKREREMERVTEALEKGRRGRGGESIRVSHPTVVGYESTEPATRPSAAVLLEVLWTAADGSGSQRTNNIVYFSDGSHRRSAFQFAPRG